ncbi:glycosyltransferase family 8 protein [Psittacicella hinzii]|uniref:Uncharacterized protein n=1 Tax=Psittacicella hinzii TaxID=2028575 RepID=A0A3A1YSJ2_9GAMM|nr:glycosyltransferase [Psittacicella hinzii]RIY38997.1 hypothetical protein CKF58_03025 [Psittacicella hinzii]
MTTLNSPYQVLLTANLAYFPYVKAFIKNFISFHRSPVRFIVIHNHPDPQDPAIQDLVQSFSSLDFVEVKPHFGDPEILRRWKLPEEHIANPQNLRLLLPTLPYHGRVVYFDLDIMFTSPVDELFTDPDLLQGKGLAASADLCMYLEIYQRYGFFAKIGEPEIMLEKNFGVNNYYFNSGFLVIDVDKLRTGPSIDDNKWAQQIWDCYQFYLPCPDQDFLNIVHNDDKVILNVKYNYCGLILTDQRFYLYDAKWQNSYTQAKEQGKIPDFFPKVIHFYKTNYKQWNHLCPEWQELYQHFANFDLAQLTTTSVEDFITLMHNFFKQYHYDMASGDYSPNHDVLGISLQSVRKQVAKAKSWQIPQIFLNPNLYRMGSLRKFRLKYLGNERQREKFALKLSQKLHAPISKLK